MADQIQVEMKFDGFSHHGAHRQHIMYRWKWWIVVRSLLCIAAVAVGGYLITARGPNAVAGLLVTAGSLGFLRPMIWQMWHERGLRKHPAYGKKVKYIFSPDCVKIKGGAGDAEVPWSAFTDIAPTPKGLLLYQSKRAYMWIPRAAFENMSDEAAQIKAWHAAS